MNLRPLFLLSIAAFSLAAAAQTSAPAASAPAGAAPIVAPNTCVKPEYPGKPASEPKVTAFNRDFKAYGECVKKYVDQNKAIAEAATTSANRAIDEYNTYTAEIKAKIEAN
jgi:hypothetical protein